VKVKEVNQGEIPDLKSLVEPLKECLNIPYTADQSSQNAIFQKNLRVQNVKKCMKQGIVPIGIAVPAAAIVGASPIPFADWVLMIPILLSMSIGISAAFKMRFSRALLVKVIFGTTSGFATLGISFAVMKFVPGLNFLALVTDALVSSLFTLAVGLSFLVVARSLYIQYGTLAGLSEEEKEKIFKNVFKVELKKRLKGGLRGNEESLKRELENIVEECKGVDDFESLNCHVMFQKVDSVKNEQINKMKENEIKMKELKINNIRTEDICSICQTNIANIVTSPCGHQVVCETDFNTYLKHNLGRSCPMCYKRIESYIKREY